MKYKLLQCVGVVVSVFRSPQPTAFRLDFTSLILGLLNTLLSWTSKCSKLWTLFSSRLFDACLPTQIWEILICAQSQHSLRFTYKKGCIIKLNPNHQRYLYQADKLLLLEVSCPTSRRLYTRYFVYFRHPLTSHNAPLCMLLHSASGKASTTRTELFAVSR